MMVFDGRDGEATFKDPSGGCARLPDRDRTAATATARTSAAAAVAARGFPYGGEGGHSSDVPGAAGGGGGAGASFNSQRLENVWMGASGWQDEAGEQNGFLLLVPTPQLLTTLNIVKSVTGDAASYGTGPFAMSLECTLGGVVVTSGQFGITPGYPQLFERIPVGASCTVTEIDTGGATDPAPPQTLVLEPGANTITMDNVFDTADLTVTLTSATDPAGTDTTFGLPDQQVNVECVFHGQTVVLGAPVVDGSLTFDGDETWTGASIEVAVPVGSACAVEQVPPAGRPDGQLPGRTGGHGRCRRRDPAHPGHLPLGGCAGCEGVER